MDEPLPSTDAEWRARLTPEQYEVMRGNGTEAPFTGAFLANHEEGLYACAACGNPLYDAETKFESGSGWPSFYRPFSPGSVTTKDDDAHGMRRTEVRCAKCDSHLGHVFPDGPKPTGERYCMNSCALSFTRKDDDQARKSM